MHEIARLLLLAEDAREQANLRQVSLDQRAELERLAQEWELRAVRKLFGVGQALPARNAN